MRWNDRGAAAAVELAVAAGLILLPAMALVASLPTWIERREAVDLAAQEAARAYVLSADEEAALAAARSAAETVAVNHGVNAADLEMVVEGRLQRGSEITVSITATVPTLQIPGLGTFAARDVTVVHSERVDDYRSFP
ncbi:MAG: hypothetical protein ACE5E8_03870 [Acidimicrobiia bacterium]